MLSFGATMALAILTDQNGLPALPLLAVAFLGANADLLWRRCARQTAEAQPAMRARPVSVALRVSDLGASGRFYRESLGFRSSLRAGRARRAAVRARGLGRGGRCVPALPGRARRGVAAGAGGARGRRPARRHDRAVATGAAILHGPRDEPAGLTARYADPDGNVVALVQS